jgi:hypothetical protein
VVLELLDIMEQAAAVQGKSLLALMAVMETHHLLLEPQLITLAVVVAVIAKMVLVEQAD